MTRSEQLSLPLEVRKTQEVTWVAVEQVQSWRTLGRKVVRYVANAPNFVTINVEKINELEDPRLRYALRFAAAAQSMGVIRDDEFSSHGNSVYIHATNEGVKSQLTSQAYSGMGYRGRDLFMEDLRSFAPVPDENH